MSDPIIRLEKASKMYRVFRTPRYRMLDALGFPVPKSAFDEFWALRNLSLTVEPGERVGLVGRNGAGKSTILKLIAGLMRPSEGTVSVQGKVQALMELGTGFHPDFTGRQNIFSSLAYQGVTGAKAQHLFEDITDFSELDEFIDKPIKTYSAGMYSRLAFATATAVKPEILIIDEILGAGDAYFAGKSARRMRDITAEGATVLFVSHDMSAVQMICDRAVWIERGRIVADGDPIEVGRRYAASIRKQEEMRLRAINLKIGRGDVSELLTDTEEDRVHIVRLVTPAGGAPVTPLRVHEIALDHQGEPLDHVLVGAALDDDKKQRVHVLTGAGYMNWSGALGNDANGYWREFRECGGAYGHAPFSVRLPLGMGGMGQFSLRIAHSGGDPAETVLVQVFDGDQYQPLGTLDPTGTDEQRTEAFSFASLAPAEAVDSATIVPEPKSDFVYGEGQASIENVEFFGISGGPQRVFAFGEPMRVEIRWAARQDVPDLSFVVCLYGLDGRCISQVVSPLVSVTRKNRWGVAVAGFAPLMVGKGEYVVSIGLFRGLTEENGNGEAPIEVQDRQYRIRIVSPADQRMERGLVVHPVSWDLGGPGH